MKRLIASILALAMSLSFAACGNNEREKTTSSKTESGKTNLTLACFKLSPNIEERITTFNNTNEDYFIEILDYSQYGNEEGRTKLNTDIMSGNTPDLIDLSKRPLEIYTNKGLLEDLSPYLENDENLSKDSFVESLYTALSKDGKLYRITPSVIAISLYGTQTALGNIKGWNVEEAKDFLINTEVNGLPFANMPSTQILQSLTMYSLGNYVDRENGTVNFDSEEFISLLEIAKDFSTLSKDNGNASGSGESDSSEQNVEYVEPHIALQNGDSLLATGYLDLSSFARTYKNFNGDLNVVGFPTEDKRGVIADYRFSIGMFTDSQNKEGCWQFIRSFLDEDYQKSQTHSGEIPVLKSVFDETLATFDGSDEMKKSYTDMVGSITKSADFDDSVMGMITEEAGKYLDGDISVKDAAKAIQSKASIYLAENK